MLALGSFPDVSLESACRKRDEVQEQLADRKDPSRQRKLERIVAATAANNTFGAIAEAQLQALKESRAEKTLVRLRCLLCDLASPLTKRPIAEITPAEILIILKRLEKRGQRETARRLAGLSVRSAVSN